VRTENVSLGPDVKRIVAHPPNEECDDANVIDGDGCSAVCRLE